MKTYKEFLKILEEAPTTNIGSGNIAGVDNPGKLLKRKKRKKKKEKNGVYSNV